MYTLNHIIGPGDMGQTIFQMMEDAEHNATLLPGQFYRNEVCHPESRRFGNPFGLYGEVFDQAFFKPDKAGYGGKATELNKYRAEYQTNLVLHGKNAGKVYEKKFVDFLERAETSMISADAGTLAHMLNYMFKNHADIEYPGIIERHGSKIKLVSDKYEAMCKHNQTTADQELMKAMRLVNSMLDEPDRNAIKVGCL